MYTDIMKTTTIPAGYRFTAESWENDGDNNKTIVTEGLTFAEAKLLTELAVYIKSREHNLSNNCNPTEVELDRAHSKLSEICTKHSDAINLVNLQGFQNDIGHCIDYIQDYLVGVPSYEDYYLRVLESFKVEEIPTTIILNDVTDTLISEVSNLP